MCHVSTCASPFPSGLFPFFLVVFCASVLCPVPLAEPVPYQTSGWPNACPHNRLSGCWLSRGFCPCVDWQPTKSLKSVDASSSHACDPQSPHSCPPPPAVPDALPDIPEAFSLTVSVPPPEASLQTVPVCCPWRPLEQLCVAQCASFWQSRGSQCLPGSERPILRAPGLDALPWGFLPCDRPCPKILASGGLPKACCYKFATSDRARWATGVGRLLLEYLSPIGDNVGISFWVLSQFCLLPFPAAPHPLCFWEASTGALASASCPRQWPLRWAAALLEDNRGYMAHS